MNEDANPINGQGRGAGDGTGEGLGQGPHGIREGESRRALPESIRCFLVERTEKERTSGSVTTRPFAELPDGDVVIRVAWSSLNYKDALAALGHPGVARKLPHVPGIDAAGYVVHSDADPFVPGRPVLVTGYELGAGRWGGWSSHIRVPADWVVPLPDGLTLRESMVLGTAGFTAAMSVAALAAHGISPDSGPIAVTGATGGVGCLAVSMLSRLGYHVAAVTGKADRKAWLADLGAREILARSDVLDTTPRALLSARWAGAVDTVGGPVLATLVRSTKVDGCVAACGLVGGADLALTVYPFLLRGVHLAGIDSALCPYAKRRALWRHLAGDWKPRDLDRLATDVVLDDVGPRIDAILAGRIAGRTVIRVGDGS